MLANFSTQKNEWEINKKKSKDGGKNSASKIAIAEIVKIVGKYDVIKHLNRAEARSNFSYIARGDIDFARNEFQRILSGNMSRALVNFA